MSAYGSDDRLVFPSSENLAETDEDSDNSIISQAESHLSNIALTNEEAFNPESPKHQSIMDRQEVEEESETDVRIKEEARHAAQVRLKIRIPAQKRRLEDLCSESSDSETLTKILETRSRQGARTTTKRKSHKVLGSDTSSDELSDSLPTQHGPLTNSDCHNRSPQPKQSRRQKHHLLERLNKKPRASTGSHAGDDEADTPPTKRPRGRPRKEQALISKLPPSNFPIAVYVELAIPHKLVRGRTSKGDKLVAQKPDVQGPFSLTRKMTWDDLLCEVSETVGVPLNLLLISEMKWALSSKRKDDLPLTNQAGFQEMRKQLQDMKKAPPIYIMLPMPKRPSRKYLEDEPTITINDDSQWGQKLSLDQQLEPLIEQLKNLHQEGSCATHPQLRCFHHKLPDADWHFELTNPRLKAWGHGIKRGTCDFNRPPIGSPLFTMKDRLNLREQAMASPHASLYPNQGHFQGIPPGFGLPAPPYSPYYPFPPHYGYLMQPPTSPGPSQYYNHPSHLPSPSQFLSTPASGSSSSPLKPTHPLLQDNMSLKEWCIKHGLGEEEHQGLVKLGFRIGEDLDAVDSEMWQWAGLGPFHVHRIKNACKTSNPLLST